MSKKSEKNLAYYISLNYKTIIEPIPDEDGGGFEAYNPTLGKSSCVAVGDTQEEALLELGEARKSLFEFWIEKGLDIPEPVEETSPEINYNGKILFRTTPEMHRSLVESASKQGVSLNQYLNQAVTLGFSLSTYKVEIKKICKEPNSTQKVTRVASGY
jgi:antitoxin HicB